MSGQRKVDRILLPENMNIFFLLDMKCPIKTVFFKWIWNCTTLKTLKTRQKKRHEMSGFLKKELA